MTSVPPRLIVIVEDSVLGQSLAEHCTTAGFQVVTEAADVAVVDGDCGGICQDLRHQGIAVVALGRGPEGGADAVIPKPVRLASLIAALREVLERREAAPARIGPWRFDPAVRLLEDKAGNRVRLTAKEVAILSVLRQAGAVVSRDRLLAEVWGYSAAVTTHTLETHIYRLRRKIEPDPGRATLLVTEAGGYRLV
jgi:DNA-binding response OmpR family regulator